MRLLPLLTVALIILTASQAQAEKLKVIFFGSSTCGECLQIKEKLLKPVQKNYPDDLEIQILDTENDSALSIMIKMEQEYNVKSSASQELFFPDTFLTGFDDIMASGKQMIESRIGKSVPAAKTFTSDSTQLTKFLHEKSMDWGFFLGTLAAGAADGINPCAIATMIFLISFMATRKRSRGEILLIGLTYTATVFITYLSMGLGLKSILEHIKGYYVFSQIIRWSAFALASVVALLSFKDALMFRKTKKTESISLQLPKPVKLAIHKVISGNLSGTSLFIGAIVTGFLVTLLEAICTGQMYIPYIVAMTQRASLRIAGYGFLVFYNFLFVLPLLVVMILAYYGMKWNDLAKKTQKNMVAMKIILGIVMTGLAVYLGLELM